jgi:hypothetical protein
MFITQGVYFTIKKRKMRLENSKVKQTIYINQGKFYGTTPSRAVAYGGWHL